MFRRLILILLCNCGSALEAMNVVKALPSSLFYRTPSAIRQFSSIIGKNYYSVLEAVNNPGTTQKFHLPFLRNSNNDQRTLAHLQLLSKWYLRQYSTVAASYAPLKNLAVDISNFADRIKKQCIYVDKTQGIYDLFKGNDRLYFLSRPRRFGKSLFISTLKELFAGNKYLFKDLWIHSSDWQWKKYPIIHLDFSGIAHKTPEQLEENLSWELKRIAKIYTIDLSDVPSLEAQLKTLIIELSKINQVVLLIDEYDKPILDHIHNPEMANAQREVLKSFYDPLKALDAEGYLRGLFITGVTKFSKTSLFSGLNNLNDITHKSISATLLGYTAEEIERNFADHIPLLAQEYHLTEEEIKRKIEHWYNGYRFSDKKVKVYNPFSVHYCLHDRKFNNYWIESGTPTFLIKLLKQQYEVVLGDRPIEISQQGVSTFDIESIPLIPLLFQAGYLTIIDSQTTLIDDDSYFTYILDFPNNEVRGAFKYYLLEALSNARPGLIDIQTRKLRHALLEGNIDGFCEIMQTIIAHIPYNLHIAQEKYYHSLFALLVHIAGLQWEAESPTSRGRIDFVIKTADCIYIFEFKFNKSPSKALEQINNRQYADKYRGQDKKVICVGLSFNYQNKNLTVDYVK